MLVGRCSSQLSGHQNNDRNRKVTTSDSSDLSRSPWKRRGGICGKGVPPQQLPFPFQQPSPLSHPACPALPWNRSDLSPLAVEAQGWDHGHVGPPPSTAPSPSTTLSY